MDNPWVQDCQLCGLLDVMEVLGPSAEVVEYCCNIAPDLMGDFVENVAGGMDTYSIRQPLGVGQIIVLPAIIQHPRRHKII